MEDPSADQPDLSRPALHQAWLRVALDWHEILDISEGGKSMLSDISTGTSVVVVLILSVLTILTLGVYNLFQLSRVREMRDDIRELRYYVVQLSRRANINLEEVTAPSRRRMPIVDRRGYWEQEPEADYAFPGSWQNGRGQRHR